MPSTVHQEVRCPRCRAGRLRKLDQLAGESHALMQCAACWHTWCEEGRTSR